MWIISLFLLVLTQSKIDSHLTQDDHMIDVSITRLTNDNIHRLTGITLPFKPQKQKQAFQNDWFVILYSPTCPHCKKAIPEWNQFAKAPLSQRIPSRYNVKIGAIDCKQESKLCSQFHIEGYPTFLLLSTDYQKYQFSGQRTKENFLKYLNQQTFDPNKVFYNEEEDLPSFKKFFKYFTKTCLIIIGILLLLSGMLIYGIMDPLGTQLQHYFNYSKMQNNQYQDIFKVK